MFLYTEHIIENNGMVFMKKHYINNTFIWCLMLRKQILLKLVAEMRVYFSVNTKYKNSHSLQYTIKK